MRTAYLDTFSGVSGDMLLGAFVHSGVPLELLKQTLQCLDIGATLRSEGVNRSGIYAVKVDVLENGEIAESRGHHHDHHGNGYTHSHEQHAHEHKLDHVHHHLHEGRSLAAIRQLISASALDNPVKVFAIHAFEVLGAAEAKIHHVPIDSIHFHEVGAIDAIADIVLAAAAVHFLKIDRWYCSPLNVGSGTITCAHGRFPVPAPTTAELLRGVPTYSDGPTMELVTPTGAALIRALNCEYGPLPAMRINSIGYGAGTKDPAGFANVLRLSIGESMPTASRENKVVVLETALDDLNPQLVGFVSERALELGAFDVMCTPVFMKKNRPGTLLTILCDHTRAPVMEDLILRETSTLGLRIHEERRVCLDRKQIAVQIPWGSVRVKAGYRDGVELKAAPEFEDCRAIATARNIPLKQVQEAALQAYREQGADITAAKD
jgi:uncharacterized protein (TIGR00299 family) protein